MKNCTHNAQLRIGDFSLDFWLQREYSCHVVDKPVLKETMVAIWINEEDLR